MASNHASREAEDNPNTFEARRELELRAGRARVEERSRAMVDAGRLEGKQFDRALRDAELSLREDDEKRLRLLDTAATFNKVEADRAGAEVIDQAQTELEAVQHIADRNEPILDYRREAIIEKLQGDADPKAAEQVTTDVVTAQAVNQPTVLANNAGVETVDVPLNASTLRDHELALARTVVPDDKHVPKTRKQAEKVARGKVPPATKVVKEQAVVTQDDPEKNEAVQIVRAASDDILGD